MDFLIIKDLFSFVYSFLKWGSIAKKVKYWVIYYFQSPINIIVFGESGTGKSQLVSCITGKPVDKERTRVTQKNTFTLPNGRRVIIRDTPGHNTYKQLRSEECQKFLIKKKVKGIINVVSYGYHEAGAADEVKIFKTGTSDVKEEFLRENRIREISQIDDWMDYVHNDCIQWIITIINKADIWYKDSPIVNDFYGNGEYFEKLKGLSRCCSLHTFEYCSTIAPFYNKPMTIIIGEQEKERMHKELIHGILQLINNRK